MDDEENSNDIIDEDDDMSEEKKGQDKKKQSKKAKAKDQTLSEDSEPVANNYEMSKFSHLKDETEIKIGGFGHLPSDDEESKKEGQSAKPKSKNQAGSSKKNNFKEDGKFKQTKLSWQKSPESKYHSSVVNA